MIFWCVVFRFHLFFSFPPYVSVSTVVSKIAFGLMVDLASAVVARSQSFTMLLMWLIYWYFYHRPLLGSFGSRWGRTTIYFSIFVFIILLLMKTSLCHYNYTHTHSPHQNWKLRMTFTTIIPTESERCCVAKRLAPHYYKGLVKATK